MAEKDKTDALAIIRKINKQSEDKLNADLEKSKNNQSDSDYIDRDVSMNVKLVEQLESIKM